jgi:predicted nucleotidyltransferase
VIFSTTDFFHRLNSRNIGDILSLELFSEAMSMPIYSIEQIKERVTPIAQRYGVRRIMLFGSYARGEATENSDVDLHVWCGNIRGLFEMSGFRLDLVDALDKDVDLVSHGGMRKKFYERIKDDEVQIYG